MSEEVNSEANSFYERPNVKLDTIQIGGGIPFGIEQVSNKELGIGGAYGSWGKSYNNANLPEFVSSRMGRTLKEDDQMELGDLGFDQPPTRTDIDTGRKPPTGIGGWYTVD